MSNDEIALLKADNARLNKIIAILIEYNEVLKKNNALANLGEGQKLKENDMPNDSKGIKLMENDFIIVKEGIKLVENDMVSIKEGIKLVESDFANVKKGIKLMAKEPVNDKEGIKLEFGGIANVDKAFKNVFEHLDEVDKAFKNISGGITNVDEVFKNVSGDMANSDNASQNNLGDMINTEEAAKNENATSRDTSLDHPRLIWALGNELRASGYNKIRDSGVDNAAKLLLHFYNKGDGSYPELRKITGHTKDGIAKFIMSMKKRGWIHRYGFQKFGVSQLGLDMIHRAWVKVSTM